MTVRKKILLSAGAAIAVVIGGIMIFSGLFGKRYVIGKNVPLGAVTEVSVMSSGMSSYDCWSFSVYRGETEIKAVLNRMGHERDYDNETFTLTDRQWDALVRKLEGLKYTKKKKPLYEVLDGSSYVFDLSWDDRPSGYELNAPRWLIDETASMIERFCLSSDPFDPAGLVGVEYGYGGDSIGSSKSVELLAENGQWLVKSAFCEGNGCKTKETVQKVGPEVIRAVREVMAEYDPDALRELPPSEEFALDAATHRMSFRYEPYETWGLSSDDELTDEARELWSRVEEIIENACRDTDGKA